MEGQRRNPAHRGAARRRRARPHHRHSDRTDRRRNLQRLCPSPIVWRAMAPARISSPSPSTMVPIPSGRRRFSTSSSASMRPATFFLIGIQADKVRQPDRAHLPRRPRNRQSHLHPSRHQQHRHRLHAGGTESDRALFRQPAGHSHHSVPSAVLDRCRSPTPKIRCVRSNSRRSLGYITIGNKIDPNDWSDNPATRAEQIAADVLDHLPPCEPNDQRCGNIILLHDGGGDRARTVQALCR